METNRRGFLKAVGATLLWLFWPFGNNLAKGTRRKSRFWRIFRVVFWLVDGDSPLVETEIEVPNEAVSEFMNLVERFDQLISDLSPEDIVELARRMRQNNPAGADEEKTSEG